MLIKSFLSLTGIFLSCDPVINPRRYGNPPFSVAVIHGGPGAGGEMAPVAQQLCTVQGILEPLQTAHSLEGQVEELKGLLEECADLPVTLIGFSWGAWLSFILAARYPAMVKRLIMVASAPFQEKYAQKIMQTRLYRLRESEIDEQDQVRSIFAILDGSNSSQSGNESQNEKNRALARLDGIFSRTDAFDPIQCQSIEPDDSIISWPAWMGYSQERMPLTQYNANQSSRTIQLYPAGRTSINLSGRRPRI